MGMRAPTQQKIWWLGALLLIAVIGSQAFSLRAPSERLGGLTPGKDTIRDAEQRFGKSDIVIPGRATYYAGGSQTSQAYLWSGNELLGQRGLTIETSRSSRRIELIMVDLYPGIGTSRSLMALDSEDAVSTHYGAPDFAYAVRMRSQAFRELFYIDQGLLVVLAQQPGRMEWIVTRLILTYPAFLRNGVAARAQYARQRNGVVEDITPGYRAWAHMVRP